MRIRWVSRIVDIILGTSLAVLSSLVIWVSMDEMITEATDWYTTEDWLFSIIGTLIFAIIYYIGIKFTFYSIKDIVLKKKIQYLNKSILEWDGKNGTEDTTTSIKNN